ncbi:MAG: hypothetical protein IH621_02380 [Krumholzibacteria bacterium]|nr:hypothetical protein [Candidatus Krumholzibacteria bacterium]
MNLFRRMFGGGRGPRVECVYVFLACPRGGAFDDSRESMKEIDPDYRFRLLDNEEFKDYWTKETRSKYGRARIAWFDVEEWDPPELHLSSLEEDLPSIETGIEVRESVRKALASRGVGGDVIERCCEYGNEDRIVQPHPGLVIWWFPCPKGGCP